MTPTVHILAYGRALCGNVHGAPSGWGAGMRWVSAFGREWRSDATCCTCIVVAERLEAAENARHEQILPPPAEDDGETESW